MSRFVSKEERKQILKELGVTKEDMKRFWNECAEVNHKVKAIADSGRSWKDLTADQMRKLPTLKEETLKILAEKEEEQEREFLKAVAEETIEEMHAIDASEKSNYEGASDYEKSLIRKIDNSERLTSRELSFLVYELEIETEEGSDHRWQREMTTIVELCGRTFEIFWMKGLTEMQENDFWNQPVEVKKVQTVDIVTKTEWVNVSEAKEYFVPEYEIEKSDLISRKELLSEIMEQYDLNYGEQSINPMRFFELVDDFASVFEKEGPSKTKNDKEDLEEPDVDYDDELDY